MFTIRKIEYLIKYRDKKSNQDIDKQRLYRNFVRSYFKELYSLNKQNTELCGISKYINPNLHLQALPYVAERFHVPYLLGDFHMYYWSVADNPPETDHDDQI